MRNTRRIAVAGLLATFACIAGAQGNSATSPGQQSGPGQSAKDAAPGQSRAARGPGNGSGEGQAKQRVHGSDKTNKNMSGRNSFSGGKQGRGQQKTD